MKFIFPQNYNFTPKILGIIEYSVAIFDIIWSIIIFGIVNIFFSSLNIKIFLCIIFIFPILIFSIVGINGENMLYVISYIIKYYVKQKVILYHKNP